MIDTDMDEKNNLNFAQNDLIGIALMGKTNSALVHACQKSLVQSLNRSEWQVFECWDVCAVYVYNPVSSKVRMLYKQKKH